MLRLLVLVSGGGTNLQAIIDAIESKKIEDTSIVRVISNKKDAFALERAAKAGIDTAVVCRKDHETKEAFEEALYESVLEADPDLIVLAGFLVVLPEKLVDRFENRIINIHPSLIPSFCGKGFYGLKVHEEALKRGVKITGATVHFVDRGCDSGPIILQKAVEVKEDDTPQVLQKRVMEQAEWKIMPEAIDLIAKGRISVKDGHVRITGG